MKLTFEEAFEVMINFHKVMHDVDRENSQLSEDASRMLFMIHFSKVKTLKEIKEHINNKHRTNDDKIKRIMEVKMSKNAKELIEKGFLITKSSEADNRIKEIYITTKGQKYIDDFMGKARQKWDEINK